MQHDPDLNDGTAAPDAAALAADWLTIWQSETAALAVDRELEEIRAALLAAALLAACPPPADEA